MVIDVFAAMDEEKELYKSQGTGTFKFVFLTLSVGPKKNGQPATVGQKTSFRPLYSLDQSLLMLCHSIYDNTTKAYTKAVCAKEVGKPCHYCLMLEVERFKRLKKELENELKRAASVSELSVKSNFSEVEVTFLLTQEEITDKKLKRALEAKKSLMLPTWMYGIKDQFEANGPWFALKAKNEEGEEKPITGMRILELQNFGAIEPVFTFIRRIHSGDPDEEISPRDIRTVDIILECHGVQTEKRIAPDKKDPSPMSAEAKAAIPTREAVRALILENRPPRIVGAVSQAKPEDVVLNSKEDFLREIARLKHHELNVNASGQVVGGSLVGASDDLEF